MNTIIKRIKHVCIALIGLGLLAININARADTITRYVMTDTLGNPVAKTDSTGEVIWRQSYTPYGQQYQQTDPDGPGFTGHRNDAATGLVYMQARYYDPIIGRFLSVDPVTFSPDSPGHFNLYWYANGNPYRYTDPDGRDTVGENIDENAQAAADSGNYAATYGWAFAGAAWNLLGNESLSQVADKGSTASTSDKVMAAVSVLSLGKGSEAETIVKDTAEGIEDAAKAVDKTIYRLGTSKESATRLGRKAQEAEDKIGVHGVSGSTTRPSGSCSSASCSSLESAGFKVTSTPTKSDPNHVTIGLPKPITKDVAKKFNDTFGR